jgi:fibronectin type 3 domain-containing protein
LTKLTYTDTTAEADKAYWYKVRAIGKMEDYNSIEAEGQKIYAAPARPNVTFDVDEETGKAELSWEVVEGAVEYKVYRSTVATKNYEEVATTEELTYTDDAASAGKSYYYKVVAVGENSVSAESAYKKLSVKCARPEIEVDIDAKSGKPEVKWEKVSGARSYEVYRATSENGRYSRVKTVTTTSCVDTGAAAGKTYYYKVKAIASSSTYNSVLSDAKACTIMEWSPPQM